MSTDIRGHEAQHHPCRRRRVAQSRNRLLLTVRIYIMQYWHLTTDNTVEHGYAGPCLAKTHWLSRRSDKDMITEEGLTLSLPHACRAVTQKRKRPTKVPNLKSLRSFFPLHMITWKDVYENSKYWSRFLIIPSNILFTSVYMCTFQPGNFTGWGSEGVNVKTVWIHCVCCFCFCLFFRYNTSCKLFR